MKFSWKPCGWLLLFGLACLAAGCASTESENKAERPWNAPMNWEYGLPPEMLEGR